MVKTNAMRQLEKAKIPYQLQTYAYDEADLSGMHAAEELHMPPTQIFKTLVTRGEKYGIHVFCIPVCDTLSLKKAAKLTGEKKIELIAVKELLGLTGYVRGGCSPIGMKKQYPTFIDETALSHTRIGISAGRRGEQLLLQPDLLISFVPMTVASLTES